MSNSPDASSSSSSSSSSGSSSSSSSSSSNGSASSWSSSSSSSASSRSSSPGRSQVPAAHFQAEELQSRLLDLQKSVSTTPALTKADPVKVTPIISGTWVNPEVRKRGRPRKVPTGSKRADVQPLPSQPPPLPPAQPRVMSRAAQIKAQLMESMYETQIAPVHRSSRGKLVGPQIVAPRSSANPKAVRPRCPPKPASTTTTTVKVPPPLPECLKFLDHSRSKNVLTKSFRKRPEETDSGAAAKRPKMDSSPEGGEMTVLGEKSRCERRDVQNSNRYGNPRRNSYRHHPPSRGSNPQVGKFGRSAKNYVDLDSGDSSSPVSSPAESDFDALLREAKLNVISRFADRRG